MKTTHLIIALSLLLAGHPVLAAGAGTTLGHTNALRCFLESRFVLSIEGIHFCDDAIKKDGLTRRDLAATYSNRGIINAGNGRYERALRDHSKAISITPTLGQIYVNRGNVYYHTHEYEKALADYDIALEVGGSLVHSTYFNRGLALLKMKRIEDAINSLHEALAITPNSKKIKRALSSIEPGV